MGFAKKLYLSGTFLTGMGAVMKILIGIMSNGIIINYGVASLRAWKRISSIFFICGIVMFLMGILSVILYNRQKKKKERQTVANTQPEKKENSFNIGNARLAVIQMQKEYPNFPMTRCIEQLEQITDYKEKLNDLLKGNDLEIFGDTMELLDATEIEICKATKSFLNYMTVSGDSKLTREQYQKLISENDKRFEQIDGLLLTLVSFIDKNIKTDDAMTKIQIYDTAIRSTFSNN